MRSMTIVCPGGSTWPDGHTVSDVMRDWSQYLELMTLEMDRWGMKLTYGMAREMAFYWWNEFREEYGLIRRDDDGSIVFCDDDTISFDDRWMTKSKFPRTDSMVEDEVLEPESWV